MQKKEPIFHIKILNKKMSHFSTFFEDLSNQVKNKSITCEEASNKLMEIDIGSLSYKEMQTIVDSDWISDEVAVSISKQWMEIYDYALDQIRAFLIFTPVVSSDQLQQFVLTTQNPSQKPELIVHNIIHKLATAGGTKPFQNPITSKMISAQIEPQDSRISTVYKIYDENKSSCFVSNPHPQNSLIISLPPFLKMQIKQYQIGTPVQTTSRKGGLQSWVIEVSNDGKEWTQIAQVRDSPELASDNVIKQFDVDQKNAGFFRHIKIMTTGINHIGNLSMILRDFDVSGELIMRNE